MNGGALIAEVLRRQGVETLFTLCGGHISPILVKQYVSKAYRASIKSGNKAAEKFADTPDQELMDDVASFLNKGAKDGDAPASCS